MKNTVLTIIVFFILLMVISAPVLEYVKAATQGSFSVRLDLSNSLPTISWVNNSVSVSPLENSIRTTFIQFNVTDSNGISDINDSSAKLVLSYSGEPTRYNLSCVSGGGTGDTKKYVCAVDMQYYDRDGVWTINVSVKDLSSSYTDNLTYTMTYGTLTAMVLNKASMNFSNAALGEQNKASDQNPMIINNRGNQNISMVNVTAFNLIKGSETLDATYFTMNASDGNGAGYQLQNNTPVRINNSFVPRDLGGVDVNGSLYLYVDVPSSGLTQGAFNSSSNWLIDVS